MWGNGLLNKTWYDEFWSPLTIYTNSLIGTYVKTSRNSSYSPLLFWRYVPVSFPGQSTVRLSQRSGSTRIALQTETCCLRLGEWIPTPELLEYKCLVIYVAPFVQRAQSQFMSNTVTKFHSTACKTANSWYYSTSTADRGRIKQLLCARPQRECRGLSLGQTQASWFLHLYSGQIQPFIRFTSDARDYIWVTAGLISLQNCVYVYYCRGASENITVYHDFPQENQNNNELA